MKSLYKGESLNVGEVLLDILVEGVVEDRLEYSIDDLVSSYNLASVGEGELLYALIEESLTIESSKIGWLEEKGFEVSIVPLEGYGLE